MSLACLSRSLAVKSIWVQSEILSGKTTHTSSGPSVSEETVDTTSCDRPHASTFHPDLPSLARRIARALQPADVFSFLCSCFHANRFYSGCRPSFTSLLQHLYIYFWHRVWRCSVHLFLAPCVEKETVWFVVHAHPLQTGLDCMTTGSESCGHGTKRVPASDTEYRKRFLWDSRFWWDSRCLNLVPPTLGPHVVLIDFPTEETQSEPREQKYVLGKRVARSVNRKVCEQSYAYVSVALFFSISVTRTV